ncbi:MAG TPA: alkaline phosphatase family protein [Candidatus Tumulicola sp.]|jgi:phospholipase C
MRKGIAPFGLSLALAGALAACGGGGSGSVPPVVPPDRVSAGFERAATIGHVVVIVQENRSFDYLFHGYPGADTVDFGFGHGKKYALQPWGLQEPQDITHSHVQFLEDYDSGRNDGFDQQFRAFIPGCKYPQNHPECWEFYTSAKRLKMAFSYAPRAQVAPYWAMAQQYALADHAFASNNGPSYPAHEYLIAGQSRHVVELPSRTPWGCDAPVGTSTYVLKYGSTDPPEFPPATGVERRGPQPCFQYRSAADLLDAAGVSWTYYAPDVLSTGGIWSAFDAVWPVRFGPDWARNVKSPETQIFNDVAAGTLPQVSWVVPAYINSDHAGSRSITGPQWVASIVNAIGESKYWNNTAIVVMWDEWGGWYDHVVPPQLKDPSTGAYEGLGYRVALMVISPYAKSGYVSHRRHEVASSLHFIEATFGLPTLGLADARADDLRDMFNLNRAPIRFQPIPTKQKPSDFLRQKPSLQPPDND